MSGNWPIGIYGILNPQPGIPVIDFIEIFYYGKEMGPVKW